MTTISFAKMDSIHRLIGRVRRFFDAVDSPVNLAVARIVIFANLYKGLESDGARYWTTLPRELLFPPPGLAPIISYIPIEPTFATVVNLVFGISCLLALVGFQTRLSACIAVICGVYAMGLPNLYGKINHAHHQVWFAAVLAVSRCGDALSVDAFIARRRRGIASDPRPVRSQAYALPLRFIWLLLGVIYFWPGYWKLQSAGLEWALSDNPKYMLYNKWAEIGGWLPAFRIDQYPILYKAGALGTIAFELAFIFLIFHPTTRVIAIVWGLMFHVSVFLTMNIQFWKLLVCYAVLVNWEAGFAWIRKKTNRDEQPGEPADVVARRESAIQLPTWPVWAVGGFLFLATNLAGFLNFNSWPITRYPTFAGMFKPEINTIFFSAVTADGKDLEIEGHLSKTRMPAPRLMGLIRRLLAVQDPEERARKMRALWEVVARDGNIPDVASVKIFREIRNTTPGSTESTRTLVYEFTPGS